MPKDKSSALVGWWPEWGVYDCSCLMINNMTIANTMINDAARKLAGGGCICHHIIMLFAIFVNENTFTDWTDKVGHQMPYLPWSSLAPWNQSRSTLLY